MSFLQNHVIRLPIDKCNINFTYTTTTRMYATSVFLHEMYARYLIKSNHSYWFIIHYVMLLITLHCIFSDFYLCSFFMILCTCSSWYISPERSFIVVHNILQLHKLNSA